MSALGKRPWLVLLLGVAAAAFAVLFPLWRDAGRHGGQTEAEPFRIAGNFYYVGASDVTAFLITSPEGHVLIDGGYPGTPPLILASIAKLGFNIKDVKILLNSEPHFDHAGGLAELQKASGAELWASEASADTMAAGGDEGENATFLPMRMFVWAGISRYAAPQVDHRFKDGATVTLGQIKLTAHITGGHSRGCTTWTFSVRDGNRELNVVSACSMGLLPGMSLVEPENYPGIRADFEHTFRLLRSLPEDIWVTSHARAFGRYRKFVESGKAKDPVAPFIDREGYLAFIDAGEKGFRELLAKQQGHP
ncbi:MAG: subclass B3 metallo-beta-lactamase [Vicinamibacteria bacterium]